VNINHPSIPIPTQLATMRQIAAAKVAQANGSPELFRIIEADIETIATAQLAKMAPVNVNLLGYAMVLLAEIKRLQTKG